MQEISYPGIAIRFPRTIYITWVPDEEIGGADGMAKFVGMCLVVIQLYVSSMRQSWIVLVPLLAAVWFTSHATHRVHIYSRPHIIGTPAPT